MNDEDLGRHVRALEAQLEDQHPDLETELFAYAEGALPPDRSALVAEHLRECARCREDVEDARQLAPRSQPRSRWPMVTVVAASLAAVALLLMTRDDVQRTPAPHNPVLQTATIPSTAAPTPPRYARAEWDALVRDARAGKPFALPRELTSLRGEAYVLRGVGGDAARLVPAGVIVESSRPELQWTAPKNARSVVTIFAGDSEVARSGELQANRWRPDRDLPRGVTYTWQVELRVGDDIQIVPAPPAPPARFRIIDAATAAALDAAKRAHPNDPLLLGLLYARAGLVSDARETLGRVTGAGDLAAGQRVISELPK